MKILLLDTAFGAVPIYDALLDMDHDVFVMGNRPDDVLARKAGDKWINQDYSRISEVNAHIKNHCIDYAVPGCTDVSMDTYCQLDINSNRRDKSETSQKLNNKREFRVVCEQLGIPAPRLIHPEEFPLSGLYICKPVDAFSGKGITVFDGSDTNAAEQAYRDAMAASRSSCALFETFEQGDLYSCSAFIENCKIIDRFYVREGSSVNPYAVDTSYVDVNFPIHSAKLVENSLEKIAKFLELKNGLLHAQFILKYQQPFFVEMTRRCPGDLYSMLIQYSTGYPYAGKYASYFVDACIEIKPVEKNNILRHTVASTENIIYQGIEFTNSVAVKAFFPIISIGKGLREGQKDRAGVLFIETDLESELLHEYDKFITRKSYLI